MFGSSGYQRGVGGGSFPKLSISRAREGSVLKEQYASCVLKTWRSRRASWTETDSTVNFAGGLITFLSAVDAAAPSTAARSTRSRTGRNTSSFVRRRTSRSRPHRSPSRHRRPGTTRRLRNVEKSKAPSKRTLQTQVQTQQH